MTHPATGTTAAATRAAAKSRSVDREARPFLVRVQDAGGRLGDLQAAAVIDASGTWGQRNPLGGAGLPAFGEVEAGAAGFLVGPLPDVLGADRARFAGRRTLVVGMGHPAANTLLTLAQLAAEVPGTEVVWAIRCTDARRLYGGDADQLAARGKLGTDLRSLVDSSAIEHLVGFSTTRLEPAADGRTVTVLGATAEGEHRIEGVHAVAAATGFRPDLGMLAEVRLDLDAGLDAPTQLAPLVDPAFHSCGTVPPHGHRELTHPGEPGLYIVGMKSYGRAPTFLITTGNEQVRSIAAHLAGDDAAADEVRLVLPGTGVCSVDLALPDDATAAATRAAGGCCGSDVPVEQPEPAASSGSCGTSSCASAPAEAVDATHAAWTDGAPRLGAGTGVGGGRTAESDAGVLPQTDVSAPRTCGSCCS